MNPVDGQQPDTTCSHCGRDMNRNPNEMCSNGGYCVSITERESKVDGQLSYERCGWYNGWCILDKGHLGVHRGLSLKEMQAAKLEVKAEPATIKHEWISTPSKEYRSSQSRIAGHDGGRHGISWSGPPEGENLVGSYIDALQSQLQEARAEIQRLTEGK
jgi:hypothetical protein